MAFKNRKRWICDSAKEEAYRRGLPCGGFPMIWNFEEVII